MIHGESKDKISIIELVNNVHITKVKLVFDVYLPNSKFRKSFSGDPSIPYFINGPPPLKAQIEDL
ncbi:unnamed protein product, partial [Vitis vinifera]|uniref:Uncharacterized protein n=1 Tax=Vitis vinifera TaxID=29760 RepID=D7THT4_VITVI